MSNCGGRYCTLSRLTQTETQKRNAYVRFSQQSKQHWIRTTCRYRHAHWFSLTLELTAIERCCFSLALTLSIARLVANTRRSSVLFTGLSSSRLRSLSVWVTTYFSVSYSLSFSFFVFLSQRRMSWVQCTVGFALTQMNWNCAFYSIDRIWSETKGANDIT